MTNEDLDQIRAIVAEAEDRLTEGMRGIETSLLTAFHSYAKGQTARLHTAETTGADC